MFPTCHFSFAEDRVLQYFTALIFAAKHDVKLEQIPAGLTAIKPELMLIGAKFSSIVGYNKMVYGPFYADIIRKLLFSDGQPTANPPQDSPQDTVTSK